MKLFIVFTSICLILIAIIFVLILLLRGKKIYNKPEDPVKDDSKEIIDNGNDIISRYNDIKSRIQ